MWRNISIGERTCGEGLGGGVRRVNWAAGFMWRNISIGERTCGEGVWGVSRVN